MTEYVVDVSNAFSFEDFVAAFNEGFCRHFKGHWHGRSWNALHDYLSWPGEESFRLILRGWSQCRGLNAQQRKMLRNILQDNHQVEVQLE